MTWLAFIASIVSALAWPLAILVLAFRFRGQLTSILMRVTRAKAFGGELEFARELEQTEIMSPPAAAPPADPPALGAPRRPAGGDAEDEARNLRAVRFRATEGAPPAYRIIAAWKMLGAALSRAAADAGLDAGGWWNTGEIRAHGLPLGLSTVDVKQIEQLRSLRNRAANEPEDAITETDALRYEDLVLSILRRMEERPAGPAA